MDSGRVFLLPSRPLSLDVPQKESCYHGRWKSNEKHLSRWLLFFWLNDWWLLGFCTSKKFEWVKRNWFSHEVFPGRKFFLLSLSLTLERVRSELEKVSRHFAGGKFQVFGRARKTNNFSTPQFDLIHPNSSVARWLIDHSRKWMWVWW
jgi:hypothetical protein